jgi:hypothetical protein
VNAKTPRDMTRAEKLAELKRLLAEGPSYMVVTRPLTTGERSSPTARGPRPGSSRWSLNWCPSSGGRSGRRRRWSSSG